MSGVSVAQKNGGQTSAIFANDTRWRPNSQTLHRRDRSNSRVTETARPSGVPPSAARPSGVLWGWFWKLFLKRFGLNFLDGYSKNIYIPFFYDHRHQTAIGASGTPRSMNAGHWNDSRRRLVRCWRRIRKSPRWNGKHSSHEITR